MDARLGVRVDRRLGNGQDDDGHAQLRIADLLHELGALDPALQERVDQDDVRPQLLDLRQRLGALADHVEQLDLRLRVQQPADVLGDLRHVLDDQQARLVAGCHRGDDTKFPSRTRPDRMSGSRVARPGTNGYGSDRDEDGPLAAGPVRFEIVAPGERLDAQAGRLGETGQLVGRHEPQAIAADPADRGGALRALLEDRRERDRPRGGVVLGRARLRHDGAGVGSAPGPLEDLSRRRSGRDRRRPGATHRLPRSRRHEVVGERLDGGLLRGPRSQRHQRVQREEPEIERRAFRKREPDEVRLDQLEAAAAPAISAAARARARSSMCRSLSTPVTRWPAAASGMATRPVPTASSRTRPRTRSASAR